VDSAERFLLVLIAAATASYAVSYILRDYWSALGSAVLALVLAITLVDVRCRRWRKRESTGQVN
jgi:membrane protein YdbS with pleckstrin-like domain